jgi:hypothetical protein
LQQSLLFHQNLCYISINSDQQNIKTVKMKNKNEKYIIYLIINVTGTEKLAANDCRYGAVRQPLLAYTKQIPDTVSDTPINANSFLLYLVSRSVIKYGHTNFVTSRTTPKSTTKMKLVMNMIV